MSEKIAKRIFEETQAITRGHFRLASGVCTDTKVEADLVFSYPERASLLCQSLAYDIQEWVEEIDFVVAPAWGGNLVSSNLARCLNNFMAPHVRAMFTEKKHDGSGFAVQPHFLKDIAGSRFVVVDDVITTGQSMAAVTNLITAHGGIVVGHAGLWNRGEVTADTWSEGTFLCCLLQEKLAVWDPAECPECSQQ